MHDVSLVGTTRMQAKVECYDNGRDPGDGLPPDRIVVTDLFFEADGTQIFDEDRIAAILAKQEEQAHAAVG